MTTKYITLTSLSECPCCAISRESIRQDDLNIIETWGEENSIPVDLRDRRETSRGASFAHGVGYAFLDADLLGGNGDGRTQSKFTEDTGYGFEFRGTARSKLCRECAQYM